MSVILAEGESNVVDTSSIAGDLVHLLPRDDNEGEQGSMRIRKPWLIALGVTAMVACTFACVHYVQRMHPTQQVDPLNAIQKNKAAAPEPEPSASLLVLPQQQQAPAPANDGGWTPPVPADQRTAIGVSIVDYAMEPTLFCYAIALKGTPEPWLMTVQLDRRTGIFGCHRYAIYSDHDLTVGMGPWGPVEAVAIPGPAAWHAPVPGSSELVWHNTGVFARAWAKMQEDGVYQGYSWTVKVDPDTAFFPGILQKRLASLQETQAMDPSTPMYLVNCEKWYSFQGPLEILSQAAMKTLLENVGSCMSNLNWKDWGEDWFVEKCLDTLGVQKREGFDLLNDYWCAHQYFECNADTPAFHPQKSTEEMETCLAKVLPSYVSENSE